MNLMTMTPILLSWCVDTLELGVDEKDPYAPRGDVCIVELGVDEKNPYAYSAIQRSWFARVNALCNLSRKKSREVAAHFRADF